MSAPTARSVSLTLVPTAHTLAAKSAWMVEEVERAEPVVHLMDITKAPTTTHFQHLPLQAGEETIMTKALRWLHRPKIIPDLSVEHQRILTSFHCRTPATTPRASPELQICLGFGTHQQSSLWGTAYSKGLLCCLTCTLGPSLSRCCRRCFTGRWRKTRRWTEKEEEELQWRIEGWCTTEEGLTGRCRLTGGEMPPGQAKGREVCLGWRVACASSFSRMWRCSCSMSATSVRWTERWWRCLRVFAAKTTPCPLYSSPGLLCNQRTANRVK